MIPVIKTTGLCKDYGSGRGVHDVTLSVRPGQVFGFLGPNGAGKSTFVKMMVGLITPSSGEATVLGYPVGHIEAKRSIGYLPELFRYQEWLTAEEVLRLHARLCVMPRMQMDRRIAEVLTDVGLSANAHERVRRFSKGMQQRLGIACALLNEPSLIFMDEPASALDPLGRHDVIVLLQRLKDRGRTVFLNTHLLEDVESVCDEVALLWSGRIRTHGQVRDIVGARLAWEIHVGGWTSEDLAAVEATTGHSLTVKTESPDGSATLLLEAASREVLGWVSHCLHEIGVTVYEVECRRNSLTEWFLTQAAEAEGGVR